MRGALLVAVILGFGGMAVHAAPSKTCIVKGNKVTLQSVTVQPGGGSAFQIGIVGIPVEAKLPAKCGNPLELRVRGPIAFAAKRDHVWLTLDRDVTSSDGLVTARRGAHVIDACVRGDRVIASAVTYSDDVLEGEAKDADQTITGFDVPCDALGLDSIELPEDALLGTDSDDSSHHWKLRGERSAITLYADTSGTGATRVLESPSCIGCIVLRELKQKKGWVLVENSGEGVTAQGWVKRAELERIPDDVGIGRSYMCGGDHGGGGWGEGGWPGMVEHDAIVAGGTRVYAGNGTAPWGVFAADTHVRVRGQPGSAWAELRHVPGLDGEPSGSPWLNGTVPLAAVKLIPTP